MSSYSLSIFSLLFLLYLFFFFFFFNDTATTEIYTLSLHDALPISQQLQWIVALESDVEHAAPGNLLAAAAVLAREPQRSEEHTSELQSPCNLVCRLLLEKKKKNKTKKLMYR